VKGETMEPTQDVLEALVEANAKLLGVPIEPDWLPEVRRNLAVAYRLAGLVEEVVLQEAAEPATIFEA